MMSDGQASALPILTPSAVLSQGNAMFSSLNVLRKQEGSFQTLHPRPGLSSHPDGSSSRLLSTTSQNHPLNTPLLTVTEGASFLHLTLSKHATPTELCSRLQLTTPEQR